MIQTSYFANHRKFPKNKKKISISRLPPKWFEADIYAYELAPSKKLLLETKAGNVSDEEYTKRYKEETLSKLDPKEIAKKYNNGILLCFEKTGDFCHRNLVAQWLRENGIIAEELIDKPTIKILQDNEFNDYDYFEKVISRLLSNYSNPQIIGEKDSFAEFYSKVNQIDFSVEETLFNNSDILIAFGNIDLPETEAKKYIVDYKNKKISML